MRLFTSTLAGALAALALTTLPLRADTTVPGFRLGTMANPAFGSVTCTLPGGDIVTFDGLSVDRWAPNGTFRMNLGQLGGFTFASFVVPTADGSAVALGESTLNGIYLAQTDGSGLAPVTTVVFNYAAAFAPNGDLYVSAATNGFGFGNDIVRVRFAPPSAVSIGHVDGPSGPLTVKANGDLCYATQDPNFPPAPGSTDVVLWTAAQIASGTPLSDANATLVGADFDGGAALDVDPATGKLFLAETNFFIGVNRIVQVKTTKALSPALVDATDTIASLEVFNAGGGTASCDAYQPSNGSNVRYGTTDFATVSDLTVLTPKRPTFVATGPGTIGQGAVTLSVQDGVPNGTMFVFFCDQAVYSPVETTYSYPGFLFHTGLPPSQCRRVPFLLPTDANGAGSFTLWNPGDLQGVYAWQCLVGGPGGVFVGSSTSTLF